MTEILSESRARRVLQGERLIAVETWIAEHEKLCADRYQSLRADLRWLVRGIVAVLFTAVAGLLVTLYGAQQTAANAANARLANLEQQEHR